jgi:hypothetical protein
VGGALIARTNGYTTGPMRHVEYDARFGPPPRHDRHTASKRDLHLPDRHDLIAGIRSMRSSP